ncbi:MAG: MarR family transcriptional regulator [Myxococcota bacterium]
MALTDYFGVTKGTVSQTLKALERRGLIEKRNDPDDGRRQRCSFTEEGKAIARSAFPSTAFRGVPRTPAGTGGVKHRRTPAARERSNAR